MDAVHPTHAAQPVGCWAPKQQKLAIEQTSGRERINIHGAIDLESGQTRMIGAQTIDAMSTLIHSPFRGDPLSGGDGRRLADDRHKIALAARLRPEDAKAALLVVEGHPLDEAGKDFAGNLMGISLHGQANIGASTCVGNGALKIVQRICDGGRKRATHRPLRPREPKDSVIFRRSGTPKSGSDNLLIKSSNRSSEGSHVRRRGTPKYRRNTFVPHPVSESSNGRPTSTHIHRKLEVAPFMPLKLRDSRKTSKRQSAGFRFNRNRPVPAPTSFLKAMATRD